VYQFWSIVKYFLQRINRGAVPLFHSFFDPLHEHMPEKNRGGDEGSLPETARFLKESRQPLQAVFKKPGMGSLHVSRVKIKNGAHGADKVYIQFVLVLMDQPGVILR